MKQSDKKSQSIRLNENCTVRAFSHQIEDPLSQPTRRPLPQASAGSAPPSAQTSWQSHCSLRVLSVPCLVQASPWDTASGACWGRGPSLVATRLAQAPPLVASFLGVLCRDPHVGLTRHQAHSAVGAFCPAFPCLLPRLRPSGPSPSLGPHMVPSVGKVGWRSCWGFL